MSDHPLEIRERELCKRDVCMYCGGRALGYNRIPDGPNSSGNYTHRSQTTTHEVLCVASSIFARERFGQIEVRSDKAAKRREERLDRAWNELGNTLIDGQESGEGV